MSWQTPSADPPPDPSTRVPPDPAVPEPPSSTGPTDPTTRVPLPEPAAAEPSTPGSTPPPAAGLISAAPVGWAAPDRGAASGGQPGGPEVAWAPPGPTVAATVAEGFVIAGVFSRVVAYVIDLAILSGANVALAWPLGLYDVGADATVGLLVSLVFLGVGAVYFVGLWRSGWQATVGMRLIGLRVLGAVDAATIPLNAAVVRWLALSGIVSIVALIPGTLGLFGLVSLVWILVLLLTTATNPLHQGMHDRWAGSVVAQRAPGGSGAAVVGCLVMLALAIALPIIAVALSYDRLREILSQVGNSI